MRVLSVDPGETSGFVVFEIMEGKPILIGSWEQVREPLSIFVKSFFRVLQVVKPEVVVLEDYRIYEDKASLHIGQHLKTAELIGTIEAMCVMVIPPVFTARLPASKKGRWPDARLKEKFPEILELESPHVRDAAALGLAYIEGGALGWKP